MFYPKVDTQRDIAMSQVWISGAFYIKLPEGDCGQFFVVSPLQPYMMCIHNVQDSLWCVFYDIPIKQDHLYLFPSWLEHGSRVNNTDGERITVSFNTTPVPKDMLPSDFKKSFIMEIMRTVDVLPLKLGAVMYPEHETVKSLLIDEINSHGDIMNFKR